MSTPNDGGPAFPETIRTPDGELLGMASGMTLRDYFAAAALQAILAGTGKEFMVRAAKSVDDASTIMGELVIVCYAMADAMIKAREK